VRRLLFPVCVLLAVALHAGEPAPEFRSVENYVPYEEFLKVVSRDPDATLMSLEEYRALVALAAIQSRKSQNTDSVLPPVKSSLAEVVYTASAGENSARFDAAFKVTVTGADWVRCDLGVLLNAGRILLDGQPAWVVTDSGRAYLLIKGEGQHTGMLSFSVPLQRDEDVQKLSCPLLRAASAVIHLDVGGRATLIDDSYPAETRFDEAAAITHFSLALGSAGTGGKAGGALNLSWKRKYDTQKSPPLLLGEQEIAYLLERANPVFRWQARVTIARRKADELIFSEPPGGRMVRLNGPNVHSWHRDGTQLRVLLEKPVLGEVRLQGEGILVAAPGDFVLGAPELKDARQDTRYLALLESPGGRIAIAKTTSVRELALNEQPAAFAATTTMPGGQPARLFLLQSPNSSVTARVNLQTPIFDTQGVIDMIVDEKQVFLRALFSVQPEQGRVYNLRLNVPAPWKLTGLRERATGRGIGAELTREGESETWNIRLADGADAAHPIDLDASFRLNDPIWGESDWSTRTLNVLTPSIGESRRSTIYLGISVHPAIDVAFGEMPAWRTERAGKLERLGVIESALRTGLMSEVAGGELKLELVHKKPRGEYELVTHVLTLEREVWVRSDIRLAVVDRAVDELVINLPPEAKDPLYIKGLDIKEIAPGVTPSGNAPALNQRRVRFNQPWQGVRMLRVEYRAPLVSDTDSAVPDIRLDGNFDSRRRIVFQSAGVVELTVANGDSLLVASLEDTPEFARPFQTGRALYAFTFGSGNSPGTFHPKVLERSPTLHSLAREMNLTTTLDASGVSRTHAEFLLTYARQQYISVKLPDGANLIALYVDGKSVRPVEGSAKGTVSVPLPPQSFAQVELVYHRSVDALGNVGAWSEFAPDLIDIPVKATNWKIHYPATYILSVNGGNIEAEPPQQPDFFALSFWSQVFSGQMPRWTAWEKQVLPSAVQMDFGGARRAEPAQQSASAQQLTADETRHDSDVANERAVGVLAIPEGAILRLNKLGGSARVVLAYRDVDFSRFASRVSFLAAVLAALALAGRVSRKAALRFIMTGLLLGTLLPPALNWQSPLLLVPFSEGLSLAALAALAMWAWNAIRNRAAQVSARKSIVAAALFAFILASCIAARAGEAGAVLVPYSKDDVKSPDANPQTTKVFVPKSTFIELMARAHPEKQPAAPDVPDMEDRQNVALASAGASVSGGGNSPRAIDGLIPGANLGEYAWGDVGKAPAPEFVVTLPQPKMIDRVRIYLLDQPGRFSRYKLELSEDGAHYTTLFDRSQGRYKGWQTESFEKRLVKSLRLTGTYDSGADGHFFVGEIEMLTPPTPIAMALGNSAYEVTPGEKAYVCKGSIEISTYGAKGWAKVPLDFGPSRLVALQVDGQPASIAHENGVPFVQIFGAGKHTINVELQGPLVLSPGRARLEAQVVCGAATRVSVLLPKDVEVETKSMPPGAWIDKSGDGAQRCQIELGNSGGAFALVWQSPDIRAKGASQISSRSYTQLQLGPDGYSVVRAERVTIDGSPVDQLSYKVIGNWEIAAVGAPDLAEWTVSGEGDAKVLRLWFQKPVSSVLVQIAGWAPLGTDTAQVAALSLDTALRQEGFIGLQHGDGRRFTANSLESLKRASSQDLSAMFTLPAESLPDRIYHSHEPPVKNPVTAELEPSQVSIETQIVGVIEPQRLLASVRSRYAASGRSPLRHEVELPAGWDVRTVRCNAMRTWEIVEDAGKRRLVVHFTGHAVSGTEVVWSAESPLQIGAQPLVLELPQPRAIADAKTTESIDWVLAADASLALSENAGTTMHGLPIERAPQWVRLEERQDYRFAFRSAKADSKLVIEIGKQASLGAATIVTFLRAADDHVQINARCRLRIEQAGRDRFTFKLPAGATLVSLDALNLRSRDVVEKPDGTRVTAMLQSAVSGEQTIDLAYRIARQQTQDVTVDALAIEDAEIKQTEHFLGVMQAERGLVTITARRGLSKQLDPEELPFVPERVSKTALAYAYAAESDWSLVLRQPDVKVEAGQAAEISLVVLRTVIAADGGVRSVATYTVRNRTLQFLKIEMPPDASLWGVLVDGQPVTVSHTQGKTGNVLWIPIQRMSLTDLAIKVSLVYESARVALPATLLTINPLAPRVLDMPVVQTYWQLYVPDDYEVTRTGGNVKDVAASVMVAGELTSNINESERLMKIADSAESSAKKRKALRSLARNQQELSDNWTALSNTGQTVNSDELQRIGRDELNVQLSGNSSVQQQANMWQSRLTERSKELEEAVAGGADAEQLQAFLDNFNFLENGWRAGEKCKMPTVEVPRAMPGEVPLAEMRNIRRFVGFQRGELPAAPAARITQQKDPPPLDGGLRDSSLGDLLAEHGAADLRVPDKGTRLTFRRVEGHPELTVSLRSKSASWRYSALGGLFAAVFGFALIRRRSRRQ